MPQPGVCHGAAEHLRPPALAVGHDPGTSGLRPTLQRALGARQWGSLGLSRGRGRDPGGLLMLCTTKTRGQTGATPK